jgi:hypothetical protein
MKGMKLTEVWRKLHSEELHNYYYFSNMGSVVVKALRY